MSDDEAAAKMEEFVKNGDYEGAHSLADELLCDVLLSLGYEKTVEAWGRVGKWYA